MGRYFPTKYLSQIHTVKSSCGFGTLQTLTTQTFQVVEMGTGWHLPLSRSRTRADPGTRMRQAPSSSSRGCRLCPTQPCPLPTAPDLSALPHPSLHLLRTSHRILELDYNSLSPCPETHWGKAQPSPHLPTKMLCPPEPGK